MSRKIPLDRAAVTAAAAELLRREGLEALTLNRLAAVLKVQTPSLYNHVEGLAGLKRELALLSLRQLDAGLSAAAMGHSGADGLKSVADAYRASIKSNPGLYLSAMRASANLDAPDAELQAAETRVVGIVLVMLGSLGLRGAEAIHAARALRAAVHGFTTLEVAGGFGLPLDLDESFSRMIGMLIAGLAGPKPKARKD